MPILALNCCALREHIEPERREVGVFFFGGDGIRRDYEIARPLNSTLRQLANVITIFDAILFVMRLANAWRYPYYTSFYVNESSRFVRESDEFCHAS